MLRSIAAVIVCYIVMFILIFVCFAALVFGLGIDGLLKPGSFQGNMLITIAAPSITIIVGLFGGWLCAKIAGGGNGGREAGRGRNSVIALAAVNLVVGAIFAVGTLQKPFPADPRPADMTLEEFMKVGREPTWVAVSNPIIGSIAVLVGGLLIARGTSPRREN